MLIAGVNFAFGQDQSISVGIVNGAATHLPKPAYPKIPLDACASGKVSVKVLIGKNGRVKEARAISGNRFFWESAVKAAKAARFKWIVTAPPIEKTGFVVYNFPPSSGCRRSYFKFFRKNETILYPSR